jgi:hypothetical protein
MVLLSSLSMCRIHAQTASDRIRACNSHQCAPGPGCQPQWPDSGRVRWPHSGGFCCTSAHRRHPRGGGCAQDDLEGVGQLILQGVQHVGITAELDDEAGLGLACQQLCQHHRAGTMRTASFQAKPDACRILVRHSCHTSPASHGLRCAIPTRRLHGNSVLRPSLWLGWHTGSHQTIGRS